MPYHNKMGLVATICYYVKLCCAAKQKKIFINYKLINLAKSWKKMLEKLFFLEKLYIEFYVSRMIGFSNCIFL